MKKGNFKIAFVLMVVLAVFGATSLAPSEARADTEPIKVAVLNVPGGGTDHLIDALEQIDELELERQDWFLTQINEHGLEAKGIMRRADDVKQLMEASELDYIVYLDVEGDDSYRARVVGPETGEPVHDFSVARSSEGLRRISARQVRQKLSAFIEEQRESDERASQPQVAQLGDSSGQEENARQQRKAGAAKDEAARDKQAAQERLSRDWLVLNVNGSMLSRDLNISGTDESVLAYAAAPYVGFGVSAEAFPLGAYDIDYAGVGFYVDYVQGFDTVVVEDGGEARAINHMEVEGGLVYQLDDRLQALTSDSASMFLSVGARHSSFAIEDNRKIPSLSYTSLVFASRVAKETFFEGFELEAGAEFMPFGLYGDNGTLFGESSRLYGFGADIGASYYATADFGLTAGYEFRLHRTLFEGEGEANFVDASGFELVQGLTGGLFYQY